MALKSVLIVTASFGEGHNAAARNLAAALRESAPDARVEVHDVFQEAYGALNLFVQRLYLLAISHTPWLWSIVFVLLDKTSVVGGGIGIFGRAARRLQELLATMEPDVVVSTYPGYGALLDHLTTRHAVRRPRLVTVVTDSLTINSVWFRPRTDFFLVANEATADVMRRAGVPDAKLRVTGFPVPAVFETLADRPDGPPWRVLYMVNSAHHLAAGVVRELMQIPGIALTVTAGKDAALKAELEALAAPVEGKVEVHGWTPLINDLIRRSHLLISKAGGATVQETLAAGTPMIITQIVPGQEEGNARLLIDSGAGELAQGPAAIAAAVARCFENGAVVYRERHAAAVAIGRPRASRDAAEFLCSLVP